MRVEEEEKIIKLTIRSIDEIRLRLNFCKKDVKNKNIPALIERFRLLKSYITMIHKEMNRLRRLEKFLKKWEKINQFTKDELEKIKNIT